MTIKEAVHQWTGAKFSVVLFPKDIVWRCRLPSAEVVSWFRRQMYTRHRGRPDGMMTLLPWTSKVPTSGGWTRHNIMTSSVRRLTFMTSSYPEEQPPEMTEMKKDLLPRQYLDVNISNVLDGVLKKYLVLIDVRDPEELRETGKIGRALNIPADEIEEAFKLSYCEFLAKYKIPKPNFMSERVVVYSKSVDISKEVCQKLKEMGYDKIKCYPGGIKEWNEVILGDLKKLEERQSMSPIRKCT